MNTTVSDMIYEDDRITEEIQNILCKPESLKVLAKYTMIDGFERMADEYHETGVASGFDRYLLGWILSNNCCSEEESFELMDEVFEVVKSELGLCDNCMLEILEQAESTFSEEVILSAEKRGDCRQSLLSFFKRIGVTYIFLRTMSKINRSKTSIEDALYIGMEETLVNYLQTGEPQMSELFYSSMNAAKELYCTECFKELMEKLLNDLAEEQDLCVEDAESILNMCQEPPEYEDEGGECPPVLLKRG